MRVKIHRSQTPRAHSQAQEQLQSRHLEYDRGQTLNCCENWQNKKKCQQSREREKTAELLMRGGSTWRRLWRLSRRGIYTTEDFGKSGEMELPNHQNAYGCKLQIAIS